MKEDTKNIFKTLILDFQSRELPVPTPRALQLPDLGALRKAIVFIGMRRSGKTWAMYQQMHELIRQGVDFKKILYINFEDERLSNLKASDLSSLLDAYFELYPLFQDNNDLHFFFDEIHEVVGWEKFIRRLLDTEKMFLYISGSSAKMLSKEIATSLRGRTLTREIFPFSFLEYLRHNNIQVTHNITSKQKRLLAHNLEAYLHWGGFPETIGVSELFHSELLQGYVNSVIYRDIIERYQIKNVLVLKKLLQYCLQNAATLFSVNKTFNLLKSQGYAISKDSLYEFMSYYEDAYCLFSISLYNFSVKKVMHNPKKIYPIDMGLIKAYTIKEGFVDAARLETAVFLHLRHTEKDIYYYRTQSSQEVDFLTLDVKQQMQLYQVSVSLTDPKTREREITALQQAMQELGLKTATIVTRGDAETVSLAQGKINCIPLQFFLLETHR